MRPTQLYQAEIARRSKEGVSDDEQPSLLRQAVSQPPTYVSVRHIIPQTAQATFFQATVREASRNIQDGINVYGSFLDAYLPRQQARRQ